MHPGLPHAPRPARPCRHGPALLRHRSRASHSLGITRAREHGMALLASAGSLCIDGGCSGMDGRSQILLDSSLQVTCAVGAVSLLMHACAERVWQLCRVARAVAPSLPRIALPRCCRMPRWQPRWPASPAEPSRMPAIPASAVLEAALLCLWARRMDVERLNACCVASIR